MVESATYLGARRVDVNGNDPDPSRLTDQFAALCALCAEHGLGVGIEFMMSTQVRTLGDALALIERSGADNAAVTVDALHLARSGGSPRDVAALDAAQISYVQLCDGPAQPPDQGTPGRRPLSGCYPVTASSRCGRWSTRSARTSCSASRHRHGSAPSEASRPTSTPGRRWTRSAWLSPP